MRILLVTPLFPSVGTPMVGADRYALVHNLRNEGHDVTVVTIDGRNKAETGHENGVYRISSIGVPQIDYHVPNVLSLFSLIKRIGAEFDVHHYYQQEFLTIAPSFIIDGPTKILTVDNFPGLDWFYDNYIIDTVARLESLTIGREALTHFDGIIFLSKMSLKTALKLKPSLKRTIWIPHGVYTERLKPDEEAGEKMRDSLGLRGIVVVFVGRLVPVKGIPYLAAAIRKLDNEGFGMDFLIVGDGPERKLLEDLKLSNSRVHLLGYKANPVDFIQAADCLVLPSLGEGCPNAILEAFACGKPVIASRVGGVPDLVKHGKTGWLVNPRDVEGLAEGIRALASDAEKLRRMGKEARKFAETTLDWRVVTRRILEFYSALPDCG